MKSSKPLAILLSVILMLSIAGNIFLFYKYDQQKNEVLEYRLQLTQLTNIIEQYENANAGSKTYDAISAWYNMAKDSLKDLLNYGTELEEEYGK